MTDSRPHKSNPSNSGGGTEDREERRRTDEQNEQEDLNQGMETGTHDSRRSGVNWGESYKNPKDGKEKSKAANASGGPPRSSRDEP